MVRKVLNPQGESHFWGWNTVLPHLRDAVFHNLLARQIGLVTDEEFVDAFRSIAIDFLKPLLDIRESVLKGMLC